MVSDGKLQGAGKSPTPAQELSRPGMVDAQHGYFGLHQRHLSIGGLVEHLRVEVGEAFEEHEGSNVMEKTGHEGFLGQRVIGFLGEEARSHSASERVLQKPREVGPESSPILKEIKDRSEE